MQVDLNYLRAEKAEEMSLAYRHGIKQCDALRTEKYDNAVILPGKKFEDGRIYIGLGGVIDQGGNFVEISKHANYFGGFYEADCFRKSEKTVVYCGLFINHWGHFLIDIVPRLWYALEADERVDEYVLIYYGGAEENLLLEGNFMEFFKLLGIAEKVTVLNEPVRYRRVIIPQLSYSYGDTDRPYGSTVEKYYSKKYIDTFNHM